VWKQERKNLKKGSDQKVTAKYEGGAGGDNACSTADKASRPKKSFSKKKDLEAGRNRRKENIHHNDEKIAHKDW